MNEDELTPAELEDRAWAITVAAAEDRAEDVDELLVTLTWDDIVSVVYAVARTSATILAGPRGRAELADAIRRQLLERQAERDGHGDG